MRLSSRDRGLHSGAGRTPEGVPEIRAQDDGGAKGRSYSQGSEPRRSHTDATPAGGYRLGDRCRPVCHYGHRLGAGPGAPAGLGPAAGPGRLPRAGVAAVATASGSGAGRCGRRRADRRRPPREHPGLRHAHRHLLRRRVRLPSTGSSGRARSKCRDFRRPVLTVRDRSKGALSRSPCSSQPRPILGDNIRTRRAYLAAVEERAARMERERDAQATLAAAAERTRIAREMHDVVAHSLSVMVAQADGAGYVMDSSPDQARRPSPPWPRPADTR